MKGDGGSVVEPYGIWTFVSLHKSPPEKGAFCKRYGEYGIDLVYFEKFDNGLDTYGPDSSAPELSTYIHITNIGRSLINLGHCSAWIDRTRRTFGDNF